jgi:hypothetical protein
MVSWDTEYLRNLFEASPLISSALIALVPVSLFVGTRYYRPALERVDTMSGIAILLCFLGVYAVGSYLGHPELHLAALAGVYLGFVVILGGRTHMFPVMVSLLPILALVLPAIAPGLVATAVRLTVLASVSVFVLAHWKRASVSSKRCEYCASEESKESKSCLYCGRFLSRDRPRIPMSMLAMGVALSIVLIVLASVSVPVLTVTGTGVNYATAGFAGVRPGSPIPVSGSWTLGGVSSHSYPGLGLAFLYPVKGAGENLAFWEVVSSSRLSIAVLSTILPGLKTNSTLSTSGNTSLPVFTWTYGSRSFTGFYGDTATSVISNVTQSQVSIAYFVGVEGQISGDGGSSLPKQVASVVAGRLSNAQKYSFLVSAAQFPSTISVYLQAVGSIAVLFGVLGFTRGRGLQASRIIENTEGLSRSDFELFAQLSGSGREGTGQEILERTDAKFGITSWGGLLTKLQRFRELDLIETRLRVRQGVPSLKWVWKVR